jgi:hypothetical protein
MVVAGEKSISFGCNLCSIGFDPCRSSILILQLNPRNDKKEDCLNTFQHQFRIIEFGVAYCSYFEPLKDVLKRQFSHNTEQQDL